MLSHPSYFTQQSQELLDGVHPVHAEQRGGQRRGGGSPHSSRLVHSPPFCGDIAFLSVFAIIFVASHCFIHFRHDHMAWLHPQRRLADEHQRGGREGTGTGDSQTCEWLNDSNRGSFTPLSSSPPSALPAPSGLDLRPSGQGYKRMWEVASEEELHNQGEPQKKASFAADSEGAAVEEDLTPALERLIEEALAQGSSIQLAPWLVEPGLEVPADLAFDGEHGGKMGNPQESPQAMTSNSVNSTILAGTVVFPPPAPAGAASADAVKPNPQQAPWAAVEQIDLQSNISDSQNLHPSDNWNEDADSSGSIIEQAEEAGTTDPTEGQHSHVSLSKEAGLQADYSHAGKAQPSFCLSLNKPVSLEAAPVSGEDLSTHPFYRTPPLFPGVVPRAFNMGSAFASRGTVLSPIRALIQINSWLGVNFLDSLAANALMRCVEELVGFAMHNMQGDRTFLRPVLCVEALALYLLILDSLFAASVTLGDSAQRHIWWHKIIAGLPTTFPLPPQHSHRKATKGLLALAERIVASLETFRSGTRPLPEVLVPLKQEILCSGVLRKFQRGGWNFFKHANDEWEASRQKHS